MSDLVGLAANAAGGGIFGLVGTALGRIAGYFEQKQSIAHEQARWAHELKLADHQKAAALAAHKAALAETETAGRWDGLRSSMAAEASIGESYRWVNAVRGLTRPLLTFLLWIISALIWIRADAAGQSSIIETATFAATAATLWWFGDRGRAASQR